jgi:isochorismate synthase
LIAFQSVAAFLEKTLQQAKTSNQFRIAGISFEKSLPYPLYTYTQLAVEHFFIQPPQSNNCSALLGLGKALTVTATGPKRFTVLQKQIHTLQTCYDSYKIDADSAPIYFLSNFTFEAQSVLRYPLPPASITVPECLILQKKGKYLVLFYLKVEPTSCLKDLTETWNQRYSYLQFKPKLTFALPLTYRDPARSFFEKKHRKPQATIVIDKAIKHLQADVYKKIVVAQEYKIKTSKHLVVPTSAYLKRLLHHYPMCSVFSIGHPQNFCFLGATPERLMRIKKQTLYTEAIGGSMKRSLSASEDADLQSQLLHTKRYQVEHKRIVNYFEKQFFKRAIAHQIGRTHCLKLPYIQHLKTSIVARLTKNQTKTPLLLLELLFPTPAVCGYPKAKTFRAIKELESFHRGMYTGTVGWINDQSESEWWVCIRSALILKNRIHLYAGVGLTKYSQLAEELQEIEQKLLAMKPILI